MMPFFNRNWAGACRGRWAGPGLLAGWATGSWIIWVEVGSLQCWSAGSGRGTPLQKQGRRVGETFPLDEIFLLLSVSDSIMDLERVVYLG